MLNTISNYCSVLGFVVSVLTFGYAFFIEKRVRDFEKKVLFNTRVPILTNDLKQYNFQLSTDLGTKNERRIRETINLCKTIIEDINPKLAGELEKQCSKIKKTLIKQYKSDFQLDNKKAINWKFWVSVITLDDLWESYDKLDSLITRIDNFKEDQKITQ
jgi:hypothetical protein